MFCKVYTANKQGHRVPEDVLRASYALGELDLRVRSSYYSAILADPWSGRYCLPALDVREWQIMRNGILLSGIEFVPRRPTVKSAVDRWPQKWWCVPTMRPEPPRKPDGPNREIDKMSRAIGKMQ